jgi:hypothetical protein
LWRQKETSEKVMAAPKGNKNALGNNGGRPALYDSIEELQLKIDEYFNNPPDHRTVVFEKGTIELPIYTIAGLAYFLGFESRQSFYAYEDKIEFSYTIKRARLRIEKGYEQNLQFNNPTGSIFALKNMGWHDKSEIEQSVNITSLPEVSIKVNGH